MVAVVGCGIVLMVLSIAFTVPARSSADATPFHITFLTPQFTSLGIDPAFRADMSPDNKIGFYLWAGEYAGINQLPSSTNSKFLATMRPISSVPFSFGAHIDYAQMAFVAGKMYAYALVDQPDLSTTPAVFSDASNVNGAGALVHCFTTKDGPVPCGPAPAQNGGSPSVPTVTPNHLDVALTDNGQAPYAGHAGKYTESFDLKPNGKLSEATDVYLKIYQNTNAAPLVSLKATFAKGSSDSVQSVVYNLAPGPYIAGVFQGTKQLGSWKTFVITDPAGTAITYTLQADGAAYDSQTSGKYAQTMTTKISDAPAEDTVLVVKAFHGTDLATPAATYSMTFPKGLADDVSALMDPLDKGSYIAAVYNGSTVVSNSVIFDVIEGDGSVKPGTTLGKPGTSTGNDGSSVVDLGGAGNGNKPDGTKSDGTETAKPTPGVDDQRPPTFLKNPLAAGLDTFPKILAALINGVILPVAIPFLVVMIMYSGFLFVTARKTGSVNDLEKAKQTLKYTMIGAALILGAFVIANALQATVKDLLGPTT